MNPNPERKENPAEPLEKAGKAFALHAKSNNAPPRPGFREALRSRILEARARLKIMPQFSLAALWSAHKRSFATAGVTALVVTIVAVLVFQPFAPSLVPTVYAQDNFTLTAENSDSLGVAADTAYILEGKEPVSAGDIKAQLKTNVGAKLEVTQVSDKKVKIAFAQPVADQKIVQFELPTLVVNEQGQEEARPYAWAFQLKTAFALQYVLPADRSTDVPLDTGIEFTFTHENVDLKSLAAAVTFNPKINGTWQQFRKTFVFIPKDMKPGTAYTVTVDKNVGLIGSAETLAAGRTFQFETSSGTYRGSDFGLNNRFVSVLPSEKPSVPFYYWNYDQTQTDPAVAVRLYKFASFDDYLKAAQKTDEVSWRNVRKFEDAIDQKTLVKTAEFKPAIAKEEYQKSLLFPASLEAGYYAAVITMSGTTDWILINSTYLNAYAAQAVDKTLVWVNRGDTKQAVAGATAQYLDETEIGRTGADGTALIATGASKFLLVKDAADSILLPMNADPWLRESKMRILQNNDYWSYLYTDRSTYKATDTVYFFGFLKPRDLTGAPQTARAWIGWGSGEEEVVYAQTDVTLSQNGIYQGKLVLPGVKSGSYNLAIEVNGETVASRSVSVQQYTKPAYTLSLTTDKDAVFSGETVNYTVHGEFFEGTPVAGLKVRVWSYEGHESELTLDAAGNATGSFTPIMTQEQWRWTQQAYFLNAAPLRAEEGEIQTSTMIMLFGPRIYLSGAAKIENDKANLDIEAKSITPANSYDPAVFAPTVRPNQTVTGTVYEVTYVRRETGRSYDFIRKVVVPIYDYDRVEKQVATFTSVTDTDGKATYQFPAANPDASYRIELTATDETGSQALSEIYAWKSYEHRFADSGFGNSVHFVDKYADEQTNFAGYNNGEAVNLEVYQGNEPLQLQDSFRFLYFKAQRGIKKIDLSKDAKYGFVFGDQDWPNTYVYGVLYTGDGYAVVGSSGWDWWGGRGYTVAANNKTKQLQIEVKTGGPYRPGEEARIDVTVKDKNGRPVACDVNLNIVDEAFYALYPETVDTLSAVYSWVDDGIISTEVSREAALKAAPGGGAERGGGGGDKPRQLFKDTADFAVISTGLTGQGSYSFKLPDNITQWRVTAQAIENDRILVGNAQASINASLPFFVNPVMKEKYLAADKPVIPIRAAGTEIGANDSVEYAIEVVGQDISEKKVAPASETVLFNLPALAEGKYDLKITAKTGKYTDAIQRPLTIVKSFLIRPVITSTILDGQTTLSGAKDGLTKVVFMDGNRGRYYPLLTLMADRYGDRADEAAARNVAAKLLNEYFDEGADVPAVALDQYQPQGVRLLPYSEQETELTAKMALLQDNSPFDQKNLIQYLKDRLYGSRQGSEAITPQSAALIYAGLAALHEPVLGEVQRFVQMKDLDVDTRLNLALALYFSGDKEAARAIYRDIAKDTATASGYRYYDSKDKETTGERTALLAILAGGLREKERDQLFGYLDEQFHYSTLLVAEELVYLQQTLPTLEAGPVAVSYTRFGKRQTVTIEKDKRVVLPLTAEELKNLAPQTEKGTVLVVTKYDEPLASPETGADGRVALKRAYSVNGAAKNEFKENDLIKVSLNYEFDPSLPQALYQITDILPAGLAPLSYTSYDMMVRDDCVWYPYFVEDQRVSFYLWTDTGNYCGHQINYYARVVNPGEFRAEPAVLRSAKDASPFNYSNETSVKITQ